MKEINQLKKEIEDTLNDNKAIEIKSINLVSNQIIQEEFWGAFLTVMK